MILHEDIHGSEPAPSDDLRRVYYKVRDLLESEGVYHLDPAAYIEGTHGGLPISDIAPNYSLELTYDQVIAMAPEAADILRLSGNLTLLYWEPTYARGFDENLIYQAPNVAFDLHELLPGSYLKNRYLSIGLEGEDQAYSDSHGDLRYDLDKDPHQSFEGKFRELEERISMERGTGITKINNAELNVLEKIIDSLSEYYK